MSGGGQKRERKLCPTFFKLILWKSVKVNSISHKSDDQFSLGYTTVKLHSLKSESDYKQYASIFTIDHRCLLGLTTTNIQLHSAIPILSKILLRQISLIFNFSFTFLYLSYHKFLSSLPFRSSNRLSNSQ